MVRHRVHALHAALLVLAGPLAAQVEAPPDPALPLRQALATAEQALREDERDLAESRYRTALLEGWLLMGALEVEAGDLPGARDALLRAMRATSETRRAAHALAYVHLQAGEAAEAVTVLRRFGARQRNDLATRRLLAQALVAAGQPELAVQELAELRAELPDDPELAFTLGSGLLRLGRVEEAEPLFAEVLAARPAAQTLVLLGRTYRDFGQAKRAAAALTRAVEMEPTVRRAHYYLGTLALLDEDGPRLDDAIASLRQELALFPHDEPSLLYLGMALVEAKRFAEALPVLERFAGQQRPRVEALLHLGRALLGLDRAGEAVPLLRRALELAPQQRLDTLQLRLIEYQLGLALRRAGAEAEASEHFVRAERLSAELAVRSRERLDNYLNDVPEEPLEAPLAISAFATTSLDALTPAMRESLHREVQESLARVHLNLGVMKLQASEFARAAELLAVAQELAPELPGVLRALAIARFNAGDFAAAAPALVAALASEPADAELRRLLALAHMELGAYREAAELLAEDPQRAIDPALEYTYATALVRSDQGEAATAVFDRLLREHADWPQLHVLLGQAHAAESSFEAAIAALQRALALAPGVPEAQSTLGSIYLRQGRLGEAEAAFRAELAHHPGDVGARYQLANVLELLDRRDDSIAVLREVLEKRPAFPDARYLMGKMLLARGDAAGAALELEAAARLAPQDANIPYQLGQAYQKLGRTAEAQVQFDRYRALKRAEREAGP